MILRAPSSPVWLALSMRALTPSSAGANELACTPDSTAIAPTLMSVSLTPGSFTHGLGSATCFRSANWSPPEAPLALVPDAFPLLESSPSLPHAAPTNASTAITATATRSRPVPIGSPRPAVHFSKVRSLTQVSAWHRREKRARPGCSCGAASARVSYAIRAVLRDPRRASVGRRQRAPRRTRTRSSRRSRARRAGFHAFWTVEHHFLEEYSHCSNPEVLYGAIAARTDEDATRLRRAADAEAVQPPRAHRGVGRGARPAQRRSRRLRDRPLGDAHRARRLRRRSRRTRARCGARRSSTSSTAGRTSATRSRASTGRCRTGACSRSRCSSRTRRSGARPRATTATSRWASSASDCARSRSACRPKT